MDDLVVVLVTHDQMVDIQGLVRLGHILENEVKQGWQSVSGTDIVHNL